METIHSFFSISTAITLVQATKIPCLDRCVSLLISAGALPIHILWCKQTIISKGESDRPIPYPPTHPSKHNKFKGFSLLLEDRKTAAWPTRPNIYSDYVSGLKWHHIPHFCPPQTHWPLLSLSLRLCIFPSFPSFPLIHPSDPAKTLPQGNIPSLTSMTRSDLPMTHSRRTTSLSFKDLSRPATLHLCDYGAEACLSHQMINSMCAETACVCLSLYPRGLGQCQAQRRPSIEICWMNE